MSQELCYAALSVARKLLKVGGTFVSKVFVGGEENSQFRPPVHAERRRRANHFVSFTLLRSPEFRHMLLDYFYSVQIMRPPATRKTSTEVYFICSNNYMGDEVDPVDPRKDPRLVADDDFDTDDYRFDLFKKEERRDGSLGGFGAPRSVPKGEEGQETAAEGQEAADRVENVPPDVFKVEQDRGSGADDDDVMTIESIAEKTESKTQFQFKPL